jgi:hypothetical protein
MADLQDASEKVTSLLGERGAILGYITKGAKGVTAAGAFIVVVAQFSSLPWMHNVGTVAATIVFLSAVIQLRTEKDASLALAAARNAMDKAALQNLESSEQAKRMAEMEAGFEQEIGRSDYLQQARDFARQAFEELILSGEHWDETAIINTIFKPTERSLKLALGFQAEDRYTICVYKTTPSPGSRWPELRLVSHLRAIDCEFGKARVWSYAVGLAGAALALGRDLAEPDLALRQVKARYGLDPDDVRDDEAHRSAFAGPIWGGQKEYPWGVLAVTVNRPGHFNDKEDPTFTGVAKSLAGILSLAVTIVRAKQRKLL